MIPFLFIKIAELLLSGVILLFIVLFFFDIELQPKFKTDWFRKSFWKRDA